ncbi:hypothetical protein [Nocardioides litoris]|uniref:hypothetical protein n=1 Tax=Nocardioides litoris TaxID=1926648 RepID=UPI0011222355|nr:hypothetical protein [Nocardioides litoris]
MARRGWVSAEVGPERWVRVVVFDELPGFARTLSDTRTNLRRSVLALAVVAVGFGLGSLLGRTGHPELAVVPYAVALVALGWGAFHAYRARWRNDQQALDDAAQARAERARGERPRRAPGAPVFKRASSAAEMGSWLVGVTTVAAADVVDVTVADDPTRGDHRVATVRLADGAVRAYTSPDRSLERLLAAFGRGVGRG